MFSCAIKQDLTNICKDAGALYLCSASLTQTYNMLMLKILLLVFKNATIYLKCLTDHSTFQGILHSDKKPEIINPIVNSRMVIKLMLQAYTAWVSNLTNYCVSSPATACEASVFMDAQVVIISFEKFPEQAPLYYQMLNHDSINDHACTLL